MINDTEFDYERWRIVRRYLDIPNTDQAKHAEKWNGLRSMGWTEEQCDLECTPKEVGMEEQMRLVEEECRKEQRVLAKYNREQAKLRKRANAREELKNCTKGQEIATESLLGLVDWSEVGLGI